MWGVADRTDYDLKAHMKVSGKSLEYTDPVTNEKYVPYVIEPSLGVERMVLAILCNAYEEEEADGETRVVLKLHHALAPYKVAVLPCKRRRSAKRAKKSTARLARSLCALTTKAAPSASVTEDRTR